MKTAVLLRLSDEPGDQVRAVPGPGVLRYAERGPALAEHAAVYGPLPHPSLTTLLELTRAADLRGRGGAGFPFARKLETVAASHGRPVVVVNVSEGEPASLKDAVLALSRPHLVLDGAAVSARALGARTVHLVVTEEHPALPAALEAALAERRHRPGRLRWRLHVARQRFVSGQARAVVELLSGRENLPVTSWQPEAREGVRGRPTLLSNAETFAHVALLAAARADGPPGTRLLTLSGLYAEPHVVEVPHGTPWTEVLPAKVLDRPVLVGGYHGTWAAAGALGGLTVSRESMASAGLALGAGVVLPLAAGDCPVARTAAITRYLAGQSAGRCGPCSNGLPALAGAVAEVARGVGGTERAAQLAGLVTGRGACAHPDGTARLVRSLLTVFGDEVAGHGSGWCGYAEPATPVLRRAELGA